MWAEGEPNEFGLIILSHDARPGSRGATVTPGNDTYGSYATVLAGASVTADVYGIEITVHSIQGSAAVKDSLTTIGLDAAGGTSYTDFISHLLVTQAGLEGTSATCGITYFFPVFIPAGASIGAKGSIHNATVGTQRVFVKLLCKPSKPWLLKVGRFVRTFGDVAASSTGTSVTAGGASEGTYTQLGSAIADAKLWFWQTICVPTNNSTFNNGQIQFDLAVGDASNKKSIIQNHIVIENSGEAISGYLPGAYGRGASGDLVYVRCQNSSATTGMAAIAYGVGG